jgi:predicted kinase
MIEHHRPYDYKKGPILQMLKHTLGQNCQYTRVFFNILRADVSGRIMDDHDKGKQKVESWIEMFEQVSKENVEYDPNRPSCFILIGCSGAGKSTYSLSKNNSKYYSWDQIRLDLYGDNTKSIKESYRLAFERSCEDKDFSKKTQQQFIELIKSKNNVIVDNTNRSRKSRRFFITEAKRHGYNVVGVLFPISLHTLKQRWETRRDKYVPWNTVEQQYMSLSLPSYYECDTIEIVTTQ